jgi:hypothetical protein
VQHLLYCGFAFALAAASIISLHAQKTTELKTGGGGSPHVRTDWTIDGANISIEYGRPFLKGRTLGKDVEKFGQVWRTGADEATIITSDRPLKFGTLSVPAGTHTINTLLGEAEWQFILGRREKAGQWGIPYRKELEIGRTPMKVDKTAKPIENVTISIDDTPGNGATLRVEWGGTSATVPFTIG